MTINEMDDLGNIKIEFDMPVYYAPTIIPVLNELNLRNLKSDANKIAVPKEPVIEVIPDLESTLASLNSEDGGQEVF